MCPHLSILACEQMNGVVIERKPGNTHSSNTGMASSNECASIDSTTIPTGSYLVAWITRAGHISRSSSACILQRNSTAAACTESEPPKWRTCAAAARHSERRRGAERGHRLLHLLEQRLAAFHLVGLALDLLAEQISDRPKHVVAAKTAAAVGITATESHDRLRKGTERVAPPRPGIEGAHC